MSFTNDFSKETWEITYRYEDENLEGTWRRNAKAVASVEATEELRAEWEEKFYELMEGFKGVPGGRIIANAGTNYTGATLINCYVSPKPDQQPDSLKGILEVLQHQSLTLKSEGGWGHNFSALRPRGGFIKSLGVESPGPVKFMELFDKSSEIITSGSGIEKGGRGKKRIRKGAQMGVLDIWHPSIVEFITAKQVSGKLSKFNMSVNCTDEFMNLVDLTRKLRRDALDPDVAKQVLWNLRFPDTEHKKYEKEWDGDLAAWEARGYPVVIYEAVSVEWLWDLITTSTYNRNEPGILFLDRANFFNQLRCVERIAACNPCGEQMLAPAGVCCLGTLNLTQFVNKPGTGFDFAKIRKYAGYLCRFLDNVNSLSTAPLPQYKYAMENKRRIGCGVMGWGSALLMLKIRFGSKEAAELKKKVLTAFTHSIIETSIGLAKEKGMFSLCQPEEHVKSPYWDSINLPTQMREEMLEYGMRNSSCFSNQPNGNSGVYVNIVTGGIEPAFDHGFIRTSIVQTVPEELKGLIPNYLAGEFHETEIFKYTKEGDELLLRGVGPSGTVYKIDKTRGLVKETLCEDFAVRYLKLRGEWDPKADWAVTAQDLTVEEHIADLAGFAQFADSAVSKTINLPNDYPFEKFQQVYLDAYATGYIKGITTYRAGTMANVLAKVENDDEIILQDVKLPDSSEAVVKILRAEHRKWYLTVVLHDGKPFALFVRTNHPEKNIITIHALDRLFDLATTKGIPSEFIESTKKKCEPDSNSDKIARSISLLLRHGVKIVNIVAELDKMEDIYVGSFLYQIKKFLASYIKDGESVSGSICSMCSSEELIYSEGCVKCRDCGNSKC